MKIGGALAVTLDCDVGGSDKKVGLRIKELERIYGIHQGNGSNQHEQKPNNSVIAKSQSDLAAQVNMSVDILQNYKQLAEKFGR